MSKLDRNKYNKRDSDFSGAVVYSTPKGAFVSGWFYKQGVITSKIGYKNDSPQDSLENNRTAVQGVKTNRIIKVTVCKDWTQMSYFEGQAYGPYYLGQTCSTTYVDDGVPDNAGGSNPTVPGGSSGGNGSPLFFPCIPTTGGGATNPSAVKTISVNGVKMNYVQPPPPIDGGNGMPPPSGSRPCPTYSSLVITPSDIANATPVDDRSVHIDPATFIKCFTDNKTAVKYTMTLYITQPISGKNDWWTTDVNYANPGVFFVTPGGEIINVGHSFVGFTKVNSDGSSVTQVMGFYPGGFTAFSQGVVKDDSNHPYDVSYTATVSAAQFNLALGTVNNSSGHGKQYILSNNIAAGPEYNCTDAAIAWMANAGIRLPPNASRGPFTNTPGDYGQALRNFAGANTKGGTAPKSHGACN